MTIHISTAMVIDEWPLLTVRSGPEASNNKNNKLPLLLPKVLSMAWYVQKVTDSNIVWVTAKERVLKSDRQALVILEFTELQTRKLAPSV